MLLLEKVHLPFDQWFIRLLQQDLLPAGNFSMMGMRQEYLSICWKEESLWRRWSESACNCFSHPKVMNADCPVHQNEMFGLPERGEDAAKG